MRDADLTLSRRRFLFRSAGIAASVALAPSLLDALDRLGPRRLLIPAPPKALVLNAWKESAFVLTDHELAAFLAGGPPPIQIVESVRALDMALLPQGRSPFRVSVERRYKRDTWAIDAIGAGRLRPEYVYGEAAGRAVSRATPLLPGPYTHAYNMTARDAIQRYVDGVMP